NIQTSANSADRFSFGNFLNTAKASASCLLAPAPAAARSSVSARAGSRDFVARRAAAALPAGADWVVTSEKVTPGSRKCRSLTPSHQILRVFHQSSLPSVRLPGVAWNLVWTSSRGEPPFSNDTSSNFSTASRAVGAERMRRSISSSAYRHWYKYPCNEADAEYFAGPVFAI